MIETAHRQSSMQNQTTSSPQLSPLTLSERFKNLPWVAFGLVLLVHVVVLWWVMGVYFGRAQDEVTQPIFVTLVVDEGAASESSPETLTERSESSPPELIKPPAIASEPPSDIALEKPAQKPQEPSVVPERTEPHVRQPASVTPSVVPLVPAPAPAPKPTPAPAPFTTKPTPAPSASERPGSGSAAGAASLVQGDAQAAGTTGPKFVTRVEYLGESPRPVYPTLARSRKQQGKVIVRVLITPQGQISSVSVQQSSGFESLDDAAIRAFASIRFKPYSENGVPLERIADIPIEFLLRN